MNAATAGRLRALLALLAALILVGCLIPGSAVARTADRGGGGNPVGGRTATGGYTRTKTLTREFTQAGAPHTDTRDVTVKVDRTTDLYSRERIHLKWSGAHPSGGRAANPFGENGLLQEYPVMVMECRGVDDPSAPAAQQLSPNTCWTATWNQRTSRLPSFSAVWTKDKFATPGDQGQVSGVPTLPADCGTLPPSFSEHVTPFQAVNGTTYSGCSADTMAPEAAVGAADPPNEIAAFTSVDGTGTADFEVRTSTENESLGCSHTVACTLVVVPIMGISCTDASFTCNRSGVFSPGSSNFAQDGVDLAVSPALWWSASNWRNRFSVPLSFALPPSTCELLGSGAPVPFYGSPLLGQAALQWSPAYCLNKKRFNWQSNTMPDDAAFALMTSGQSVAAEVTGQRDESSPDPVAYAPTAVSGFGIAFDIDRPNNGGQQKTLNLNARLLAKLLTMSYPASTTGQAHPGLSKNPISLNLDPEFRKLNPGLDTTHFSEAAATLLSLSTSSDIISSLTRYIAADPEAAGFMTGKADPWGMRINPDYKDLTLPVSTWPILDTWIPDTPGQACLKNNPAPYLPKVAAPLSTMAQIATAMILNWPNVQTVCDTDPVTGLYKLGRIPPQGVGSRFMLGLVSLGDAARYGLPVASLQAAHGKYVAASASGLAAAVRLAEQQGPLDAFAIDQAKVRRSASAYPGMLVVSTAARTSGLAAADAKVVGDFIDISSTEGQVPGRGNGHLPAGYLPITKSGSTAKLFAAAQRSGAAIRAQKGVSSQAPSTPTTAGSGTGSAAGPAASAPVPAAAPVAKTSVAPVAIAAPKTALAARTTPTTSQFAGLLIPVLLGLGVLAGVAGFASRMTLWSRGVK